MNIKKIFKNEKGFTLVEIIAVLVILGVLAAVATPRFINLTADAERKALDSVVAELQSRANMYYGRYLLDNTSITNVQNDTAWAGETGFGPTFDFTLADTTPGNGAITVSRTGAPETYKLTFAIGTNTGAAVFGSIPTAIGTD